MNLESRLKRLEVIQAEKNREKSSIILYMGEWGDSGDFPRQLTDINTGEVTSFKNRADYDRWQAIHETIKIRDDEEETW